jgi:formylglycine-generating enzyme
MNNFDTKIVIQSWFAIVGFIFCFYSTAFSQTFIPSKDVQVEDELNGKIIQIGIAKAGQKYDILSIGDDLIKIKIGSKEGYVDKILGKIEIISLIFVEGGTFQMGGDKYDDEKPIHSVTVKSFYIGKYEETQKQWQDIMGNNPSYIKGDNLPVQNVSWNDVQEFIRKLNQREGTNKYRLPTEAEWEYAARGGNKSKGYTYSGSNNLNDVSWYGNNSNRKTHPVGLKQPNELGLYDMSGNVWEWCQDWYDANYYFTSPSNDPKGPQSGTSRVLQGGSSSLDDDYCRVAYRGSNKPDVRYNIVGFRLLREN